MGDSIETRLERVRAIDVETLADAIESVGFECTRCGACCRGTPEEPHVATITPDEARRLQGETDAWRDVAKPVPFGVSNGEGETFEWALATECGSCVFYEEGEDAGRCSAYGDRPLVCRTYPFSLAVDGVTQPLGAAVERTGPLQVHECEGVGRDIDRAGALDLARAVKERAVRDLEEEAAVLERYRESDVDAPLVVYDSEGPKDADGRPL